MNTQEILVVVDMQNDFVDGALGTPEAVAIVPKVVEKIRQYHEAGKRVIFTLDQHRGETYASTIEGQHIPVPHCIVGERGWGLSPEIAAVIGERDISITKHTFGADWKLLNFAPEGIEICGLCTDICVVSNALTLRARFPNTVIACDASCCAGSTPENHDMSLETIR